MEKETLNEILDEHKEWLETGGKKGKRADLHGVDLRDANLRCADLRDANLRDANLRDANLRYADLSYADLRYADLSYADLSYTNLYDADLSYANLSYANLSYANLHYANLRDANLRCANLDYSALPLWCGGLDVHIDDRQATQLLYHLVRNVLYSKNTSKSLKKLCSLKSLVSQANKFHRVNECGYNEEAEKD